MTSNKGDTEGQTQESCGAAQDEGTSTQVRIMQVPAKGGSSTLHPQPTSTVILKRTPDSSSIIPTAPLFQLPSSKATTLTSPQPVKLVAKTLTPAGMSSTIHQGTKQTVTHVSTGNQATTPARTVVISVPKAAAAQPVASKQLPASFLIPPGMMLIRSDSGQLMLVSQQALAQVQQAPRIISGQAPRIQSPQVSSANVTQSKEKVAVIRMPMATPPAQKMAVVVSVPPKVARVEASHAVTEQGSQPGTLGSVTPNRKESASSFSQETLESVKKCKNFLITLIKLASSDSRSATMANSVKELVCSLLEGKIDAEEFTEQLYCELKSTPQPCLVPFLKKSLSAVRRLITEPKVFIQQASSSRNVTALPSTGDTGQAPNSQQAAGVSVRPSVTSTVEPRSLSKMGGLGTRYAGVHMGKDFKGFPVKVALTYDRPPSTKLAFKHSSGSYREDDDINDVASMAGVNLREENAQILTSVVGSVVQSCQDQLFLSPHVMHSRIIQTGQRMGVTDVGAEVIALVSHATQEHLRGLLEKVTLMAAHRNIMLKDNQWHVKVSDVRSQFRFLEEVESLKKKKQEGVEKEKLLRLARSRSHREDPLQQELKQRAKELQLIEQAQLQQREANLTALAAIGPRKKRPIDQTTPQVSLMPRQAARRITRVMMRDLLLCMEQEPFLRHSLTFYKAML